MKLLVVSPSFYPDIGVAQNYTLNICLCSNEIAKSFCSPVD